VNLHSNLIRPLFAAAALLAALTLGGCASSRSGAAVDTSPVAQSDYLIGPGDSLSIIVWRNPEVSQTVPVRPDGKITTPLVEDLPASGKTSTELARDIEKALSKFIQQPVVTVIVTGFVGTYGEQIRVIGQAAKPQSLPYRRDMSILDVMIAVGGLTDFAAGNEATILRSSEGNKQYSVRLKDLIKRGDVSANVEMRPGDILIIPQSFF